MTLDDEGVFAIIRDEGATRSDSAQAFGYGHRVAGVRCKPRER